MSRWTRVLPSEAVEDVEVVDSMLSERMWRMLPLFAVGLVVVEVVMGVVLDSVSFERACVVLGVASEVDMIPLFGLMGGGRAVVGMLFELVGFQGDCFDCDAQAGS